jgi:hypothetical protein
LISVIELTPPSSELNETLVRFREAFHEECRVRQEREAAIKEGMDSHEKEVEERFAVESEARESVRSWGKE